MLKSAIGHSALVRYTLFVALGWTATLGVLFLWNLRSTRNHTTEISVHGARTMFQEILTTRLWNARHGGVYVLETAETPSNPYLDVPDRDVVTLDGRKLTKINPAYMTRQIGELARSRNNVWFHITSSRPIRPENSPDPWEAEALEQFQNGMAEVYEFTRSEEDGPLLRYMAPLWVEEPCLNCHARQGYSEGELRGGISVTIPAGAVLAARERQVGRLAIAYVSILVLGLIIIITAGKRLRAEEKNREQVIVRLNEALERVHVLKGLLPICASCKNIRDPEGGWNKLEAYISRHSEAQFSHGICPDCLKRLYPEVNLDPEE